MNVFCFDRQPLAKIVVALAIDGSLFLTELGLVDTAGRTIGRMDVKVVAIVSADFMKDQHDWLCV